FSNINQLTKDLAFNLGGHTNHSIFWNNLSPEGGDKPTGELASAIDEFFGSFDNFKAQFTAAALGIQGSGWAILAYEPIGGNLVDWADARPRGAAARSTAGRLVKP